MSTVPARVSPDSLGRNRARTRGPRAAIIAVGGFLPADVLDNAELERVVDTSDAWILERTGIRERRRVGPGETASTMGAAAARVALARAGGPPIDAIICATCSPDTLVPSVACLIQRRLQLPGNVPAFDVNAACSGFIYAHVLAQSLIGSGAARHVLVVASEAMTSLVDFGDRSTCVLFGDGAAATVVGATTSGGIAATNWAADGGQADLIYYGADATRPADGIRMAGKGTFRLAVERMCEVTLALCDEAGWAVRDIDHFIPHQANQRIIEAVVKRLEVDPARVVSIVERVGNTSAASIPLALSELAERGSLAPGARIMCAAFGAGATWGGMALEWTPASPRA